MKPYLAKAKDELDRLTKAASDLYAEFNQAKSKQEEDGVDLMKDDDAFNLVHEKHKAYQDASEAAEKARTKYMDMLEMEGEKDPSVERTKGDANEDGEKGGLDRLLSFSMAALGEKMADALIESDQYKALQPNLKAHPDSAEVKLPAIEGCSREELKAFFKGVSYAKALVSGAGATTGDVVIVNDRQAGQIDLPRNPRAVLPLVGSGTTDSDTVEWVEFTSRTNAAAERPEATTVSDAAADAPESGFVLTLRNTVVREIKHFIPATRIGLADAGQLRTLVDQELLEGLQDRLELQILTGNGTAPNLRGILNTSGIQTQPKGADSNPDAIYKAITKIVVANFTPDGIVMNPNDWALVRLQKDSAGNYMFGNPQAGDDLRLWSYPVRLSPNITAGTALVGAFARGATLWLRQGAAISATDSHSDWFIRGVIAVLASMRAAFGVPRPLAFCTVTGIA